MKDFYRQLNVAPYAAEQAVREALREAGPELRLEAEFILLEAKRRRIYDRDHRLLLTIGQLRMHMGLNYTRFWARKEYKDFWSELAPAGQTPAGRRVDSMLIVQAFGAVGRHGRRHAAEPRTWLIAVAAGAVAIIGMVIWHFVR